LQLQRKTEGVSGANIENQTPDRQLEYCLQDAQLCMKLVRKNDYELLRILHYIGKEIGLDLAIKDKNGKKCNPWYSGGDVLDPVPGQHRNVLTFDVSSMYPTMSCIQD
jgi:DNA polymerase elongation subunit (family B)